jgi:hypothetical protein
MDGPAIDSTQVAFKAGFRNAQVRGSIPRTSSIFSTSYVFWLPAGIARGPLAGHIPKNGDLFRRAHAEDTNQLAEESSGGKREILPHRQAEPQRSTSA